MNEVRQLIEIFLEENEKGLVHLIYPTRLDHTAGIELTKDMLDNENKIKFLNKGMFIRETMGYSLITGKHLFLPYEQCVLVFIENREGVSSMERYIQTNDGNVKDTETGFVMDLYYVIDLLNMKEDTIERMRFAFKRKFDYDIEDVVDEVCDEDY